MPKTGRGLKGRSQQFAQGAETRMTGVLDDLAEFEQYRIEVLKKIRDDRKAGLSGDEIIAKYKDEVRLRQLTIALAEADSSKALAAIKDLRDRDEGKATEKQEITHRLEKLPDAQLDAVLMSELKQAQEDEDPLVN